MKVVKIEEGVIDLVESDIEHPWQHEFDIAGLNADYYIVVITGDFGSARSEIFSPRDIAYPAIFSMSSMVPIGCEIVADATGIRVQCKDRNFKRATLLCLDSKDGRTPIEVETATIDLNGLTEIGSIPATGGSVQAVTGTSSIKGPDIVFTGSQPITGDNIRVWYVTVNGYRYYCDIQASVQSGNEVTLKRWIEAYRG